MSNHCQPMPAWKCPIITTLYLHTTPCGEVGYYANCVINALNNFLHCFLRANEDGWFDHSECCKLWFTVSPISPSRKFFEADRDWFPSRFFAEKCSGHDCSIYLSFIFYASNLATAFLVETCLKSHIISRFIIRTLEMFTNLFLTIGFSLIVAPVNLLKHSFEFSNNNSLWYNFYFCLPLGRLQNPQKIHC